MNDFSKEGKESLKRTIQQKFDALMAMVDDTSVVRNAAQLIETEKMIAAITDEIAGHVTEAVVDRSVHDEALTAEAKALVKNSPVHMKRRGQRSMVRYADLSPLG